MDTPTNEVFLPQGYRFPNGGYWMRLERGENRIRILSSPVIGWLQWKDGRPHRYRYHDKPTVPDGTRQPKHFWIVPVWNYRAGEVQLLELTQSSVQKAIKALADDDAWGSPPTYDLKIIRRGEGKETRFDVLPLPKAGLSPEIAEIIRSKSWNLERVFDNENVFDTTTEDQ